MRIARSAPACSLRGMATLAALALAAASAPAFAVSTRVEQACRDDYFRLCSAYAVGSPSLRNCMESKAKNITPRCITAMRKEGLIDPKKIKR